jgi:hypothetical protein
MRLKASISSAVLTLRAASTAEMIDRFGASALPALPSEGGISE